MYVLELLSLQSLFSLILIAANFVIK